jgi:hypothetical protein
MNTALLTQLITIHQYSMNNTYIATKERDLILLLTQNEIKATIRYFPIPIKERYHMRKTQKEQNQKGTIELGTRKGKIYHNCKKNQLQNAQANGQIWAVFSISSITFASCSGNNSCFFTQHK